LPESLDLRRRLVVMPRVLGPRRDLNARLAAGVVVFLRVRRWI
jgi:hypothetical protein